MNAPHANDPRVFDGWLRLKGGVEVAGIWVEKRDYDLKVSELMAQVARLAKEVETLQERS